MDIYIVKRTYFVDDYKCRYGEDWTETKTLGTFKTYDDALNCKKKNIIKYIYDDVETLYDNKNIMDYHLKLYNENSSDSNSDSEYDSEYDILCFDYDEYEKYIVVTSINSLAEDLFKGEYVEDKYRWEIETLHVE